MMTTNADRKLLALAIKSGEFTAKELAKILEFLQKAIQEGLSPTEQKTYADFQNPGGLPLLNVSPGQEDVQTFTGLAQQDDVNVSVKHNQENGIYYLVMQGQLKDIEQAAAEYRKKMQDKTQSRSTLLASLEQAKTQTASYSPDKSKAMERERYVSRDS